MSSSNFCFLNCIQISQEADKVVWYSYLFNIFPHFVVIHTLKGFGIVNKAEVDVFLELSCFFDDPTDVGNLFKLDLEKAEEPEIKLPAYWIMEEAREFQTNIYFCFIDYAKAFDCVDHNKLWKILKEMGILDHLT